MDIEQYPWLDDYLNSLDLNKFHHAHIIGGRGGLGKWEFAKIVSKYILCKTFSQKKDCACKSCNLFLAGNHPDFYFIFPERGKKLISINQIRELHRDLYESAFLNSNKVFVIKPAELLTHEAEDSTLKILEEPPQNTFFLLVSNKPKQLSPTIRSRCSQIDIQTPLIEQSDKWLSEKSTNEEERLLALEMSKGRPLIAMDLLSRSLSELRTSFISDISDLIKGTKNLITISEIWAKDKSLDIKLEWMGELLGDSLRHQFYTSEAKTKDDTDHISSFLGKKVNSLILFNLLNETNQTWFYFSEDSNLRIDYQLQSLFVSWNTKLGIGS